MHGVLMTIVLPLSTQRERGPGRVLARQALGSRRSGDEWLVAGGRALGDDQCSKGNTD